MQPTYVHGYTARETRRLADQADTLAALLHDGTAYPAGSRVLEAGCGVGAQTVHLVTRSPGAHLTSIDISAESLVLAQARVAVAAPDAHVEWHQADLLHPPFPDASFDHLFVCFVLEHLPDPHDALLRLKRLLRPGGGITVIEGDHGSAIYRPRSDHAQATIDCLIRMQAASGGDALIGRRLHPLLSEAGFGDVVVEPRTVYADRSRPSLVDGFTRNTFIAMVESARKASIAAGLMSEAEWNQGIADLERTAEEGTFHYTFFKATALTP